MSVPSRRRGRNGRGRGERQKTAKKGGGLAAPERASNMYKTLTSVPSRRQERQREGGVVKKI